MDYHYHYKQPAPELERLDDLRADYPVIWALCVGHRTSKAIAHALGVPRPLVLTELRQLKRGGWVHDEQAPSSVVWKLERADHLELYEWVRAMRRAEKHGVDIAEMDK